MAVDIPMRRDGGHAVPVDAIAAEEFANAVADRSEFMATCRRARSIKQHRWAWALAQKVAEAHPDLLDRDQAMHLLKLKARFVAVVVDPTNNRIHLIPKSIAWDKCPQEVFNRLMNRFVYIVVSELIPGMDEGDLRNEIEAMVTK